MMSERDPKIEMVDDIIEAMESLKIWLTDPLRDSVVDARVFYWMRETKRIFAELEREVQ